MTDGTSPKPTPEAPAGAASAASVAKPIFVSLMVVSVCALFLRFGSLIVSIAISHTWSADDPMVSAYAFLFRQFIMVFVYPSVLNLFRPAFIPLYNEVKRHEGEQAATAFAAGVLQIGMMLAVFVCGLVWLFPELTVQVMAPRFSPDQHAASVTLMRQMAPGILCLLLAEMYLIYFHAEKKFAYPHGAEALQKIAWGVGIVVVGRVLRLHDLAIGVTYSLAALLQLAVTAYGMRRTFGWAVRRTALKVWGERWGKRAWLLVLPLMVGIAGAVVRDWVTHWLQSDLDKVAYVGVEYARQLANLPKAFLGQIISMVMLPHLASILHSHGRDSHRRTLETTIESLTLLSIPVVAGMVVLAPELTALIFIGPKWGPAEHELCEQGALAIRMISIGFLFIVLENILLPGLFSIQSMWWPIMWGLAASGVQVLAVEILAQIPLPKNSPVLIAGVAFAYPLSRILKNGILLVVLRRKTGIFAGPAFGVFTAKMAGLLVACLGLAYLTRRLAAPLLGGLPVDQPSMAAYKLKLAVQIGVPSAVMGVGFLLLVVLVGYRQRVAEIIRTLRNRKGGGRKPADADPTAVL